MLNMIRWIFILLLSTLSFAKEPIKVVIMDTGLDIKDNRFTLCENIIGLDFTNQGLMDVMGHGTHIAGIIKKYAGDSNYCFIIMKYYSDIQTKDENLKAITSSLKMIKYIHPDFVNFSGGGPNYEKKEYDLIKDMPNVKFVVAAGNENINLDEDCDYYPACYKLPNIIVVGSLDTNKRKAKTSNYGNIVNFWEIGQHVKSTLPNDREGYMSGTSMATAVRTGKLVNEKANSCDISNTHCK